ncbi:hypothetical protein AMTR_s00186p00016760 [Amborella trichopoda]|uniref:Uncharacterized protein n=1 Tax=Amborella trichopoda TaxID=13333 RepID=W1P9Y5_AMBTC|nr:hypothetical protein AMTR_s00186p00016760 [Amborella trichopoda]
MRSRNLMKCRSQESLARVRAGLSVKESEKVHAATQRRHRKKNKNQPLKSDSHKEEDNDGRLQDKNNILSSGRFVKQCKMFKKTVNRNAVMDDTQSDHKTTMVNRIPKRDLHRSWTQPRLEFTVGENSLALTTLAAKRRAERTCIMF